MTSRPLSRRDIVICCLTVAGFSGCSASSSQPDQLGAESVTARSIPAGSDRLAVFDMEHDNRGADSVSNAILTRRWFDSIPDPVSGLLTATTGPLAETDGGKIACIHSNDTNGSAAIVWARWTDGDLANALGSNVTQGSPTADGERIRYETDTSSAVRLADTVFALGDHETVGSVVDVWHHDGEVVSEDTVAPFERTDRNALVRYATQTAPGQGDARPQPYNRIENGSAALEDDLIESSRLTSAVSLQLEVGRNADVIEVTYEADESTMAASGPDVFTTAMDSIDGV